MVSLLLQFLRAERTGNWKLHLSAFADMLPWFAVYDHTNYTRWGAVYLADMKQLEKTHPDVYKEFMEGNFVVKRTDHKFNQISTDQSLEHINRVCKVAGGLIGITRSDSARDRWCLTFNERSRLVEETYAMFEIQTDDPDAAMVNTKETGAARIARDEADVAKIMHQLLQFGVFSQNEPLLVSLASHDVAPDDIGYALMNAKNRGTEKMNTFIQQRLCAREVDFHAVLQKTKSPTLSTMYSQRTSATAAEKTKVLKADRNLFQRLLVAQSSGRTLNLPELLQHELFPVPLALADTAGNLRSTQKAVLAQVLEEGVTYENLPPANGMPTCTIIDGQALVQAIGKPKGAKTFGDLADVFVHSVFKFAKDDCKRVDVVFDRYDTLSIKAGTRTKRMGSTRRPIRRIIEHADVPLPSNWKQFIDLPENKADLSRFLSEQIMLKADALDAEIVTAGGFTEIQSAASSTGRDIKLLQATHEEADTRVILHALDAARQPYERTLIVCRDTDVLVLLIHFQQQLTNEIWFQSGTAKQRKYVAVHDITLSPQLRKAIPAFHALTGCDTVSQFSGHGKKSAWKVFKENARLLQKLGHGNLNAQIVKQAESFICKLYAPDTEKTSSDDLRCTLFLQGKCEPENLPPTSDALELHIKRAHHQASIWMQSTTAKPKTDSPVNNGWYIAEDGDLKPLLSRKEAVPKICVDILTCKCKVCATSRCTCRSNHLKCTMACGCTQSHSCQNPLNNDSDSDTEYD